MINNDNNVHNSTDIKIIVYMFHTKRVEFENFEPVY